MVRPVSRKNKLASYIEAYTYCISHNLNSTFKSLPKRMKIIQTKSIRYVCKCYQHPYVWHLETAQMVIIRKTEGQVLCPLSVQCQTQRVNMLTCATPEWKEWDTKVHVPWFQDQTLVVAVEIRSFELRMQLSWQSTCLASIKPWVQIPSTV